MAEHSSCVTVSPLFPMTNVLTSAMRQSTIYVATASVLIGIACAAGCKSQGVLAKREAEKCCPTDIRKTVPWCAGEDALFKCPCEPNAAFYGYKPTCWRTWPASGATWRDLHCGKQHHDAIITDISQQNRELIQLPAAVEPDLAVPGDTATPAPDAPPSSQEDQESAASPKIGPKPPAALEPPTSETETNEVEPPKFQLPRIELPKPSSNRAEPEANAEDEKPLPVLGPVPLPPVE